MEATKFDDNKPRYGLVVEGFSSALQKVGDIGSFGAKKYAPNNWKLVEIERYEDAFMRHYLSHLAGDKVDDDSGYTHLAHAAWNILAMLERAEDLTSNESDV